MTSPVSWSFTTDSVPPAVTTVSPPSGATNNGVFPIIGATFNEPIEANSISFTLTTLSGTLVPATLSYNSSTNTAVLVPSAALAYSTTYTATINGALDTDGDPMSGSVTWSFATESGNTPPAVISVTPASGATAVASSVSALFNEPIQAGTIKFTLADSSGIPVPASVSYNSATGTATLTPSSPLAYGTTYTATVSGAENSSGVAMSAPVSWSFVPLSPVAAGLVAEWQFNEGSGTTTADDTGDGNNGTLVGSVSWTTGLVGPYALNFSSASAGHVLVPDAPDLEFSATQSFTLSAWVDVTSLPGAWTAIVEKSRDAGNWYGIWISPSNQWVAGSGNGNVTGSSVTTGWSQVVVVQNGSANTQVLYVDGVEVASGAAEASNGTGALWIGGDSLGEDFNGTIDDVRLYDTALSTSLVQDLYTTAAPVLKSGSPANGATNTPISSTVAATFNEPEQASTIKLTLTNSSGTSVPANVTYNASTDTATLTPTAALAAGATYTVAISGAENSAGLAMTGPVTWSFTTAGASGTAPSLTSESPTPNGTGVAVSTPVTATFNEAVQSSTITFTLTSSAGTSVGGSLSYNTTTNIETFTPTSALAYGTTYTATVSGAKSTAGVGMAAPSSWSFTTDSLQPAVSSHTPASGASGVATSSAPTATFNEAVQSGTITFTLTTAAGSSVPGTLSYNSSTNTETFTPSVALASGTAYTATVSGAKDAAGDPMSGSTTWTFTTAAAPTVTVETPASGATQVPTNSVVTATFSEAMLVSTITGSDFVLKSSSGTTVTATVSYSATTLTATLTPSALLSNSTTYTATVSGVTDLLGDLLGSPFSWSFTTGPAPSVTSHSPLSSATGVPVESIIGATFNESVQSGTVALTLTSGGTAVAGTLAYSSTTNTETFTPASPLAYGTAYTATVSGAKDTSGDAMAAPVTWSFTTDPLQPTVSSDTPASGGTGVALSSGLTATFNEPVQSGTVTFTLATSAGTTVAGTATYNTATNTETFTPTSPLLYGTTYTATVSGAKDTDGGAMAGPVTWSFTTDPLQPSVSSHTPASGATGAAVSSSATATFNEAVQGATITFTLAPSGGAAVAGTVSYNTATETATFTPTTALAMNTTYTATVSGAQDADGDPMSGSTTWSFTTDALQPAVSSHTPASGATGVAVSAAPSATFNEAVQSGTVTFTLATSAGTAVAGSATYNSATNSESFTPTSPLLYGTTYTATVSGAKDTDGDPMSGSTTWTFTTDALQPAVSSHTPASGATGLAVSAAPSATFNEAVQSGTVTFTLATSAGTAVAGSATYNAATNSETFTPTSPLLYGTTYTATVSGAKDTDGDAMAGPVTWSCTTDPLQPSVSSHTPTSGATGVTVSSSPTATFNEAVQSGTVTFTLATSAGTAVAGTASYNAATNTETFTPTAPLAYGTTYTATVSGAKDTDGDPMSGSVGWSFTTSSPTLTASAGSNITATAGATVQFAGSLSGGTAPYTESWNFGDGTSSTANTATFVQTDTTTQGNWIGNYGNAGYNVIGDVASYPSYATVTASSTTLYTWTTSTSNVSALQEPGSSSRIAAAWDNAKSFVVNLNLTDGQIHPVSLYALDYDQRGRVEQIQVLNGSTGAVLNSQTIRNFSSGEYLTWNVSGNVEFKVTDVSGVNAVLSGLFIGAGSSTGSQTLTPTHVYSTPGTYTATLTAKDSAGHTASSTTVVTVNSPAPTVTAASPSSTGVAVSTNVTATFNEAVQSGSITFTLKNSAGTAVPGSVSYNSTTNTATFAPSTSLAYGTTFTATVSGAESTSGIGMSAPFSWPFTTDALQPAVSAHTPASGATGVAVSAAPSATFNEAVQSGTIKFTLATTAGSAVAGTASYNATTYSETFTPTSPLLYGTTYTASVSGAKDTNGDAMAGPVTWSFTTAAAPSTSGLVAEWQFNEGSGTTTADNSGDGHTGTLVGSVSWTTGLVGPYALSFSSSNSGHVVVPDSPSLRFTASQSFSLTVWAYVPSLPNRWTAIVDKSRNTGSWYGIWINPSNQWVAGGLTNLTGTSVTVGWHQLSLVQNASANTRVLYVDGVQVVSGAAQTGNGTGDLWIGGAQSVSEYFNGTIDDVRVYDIALSAAQVQSLAAAESSNGITASGAAVMVSPSSFTNAAVPTQNGAQDSDVDSLTQSTSIGIVPESLLNAIAQDWLQLKKKEIVRN